MQTLSYGLSAILVMPIVLNSTPTKVSASHWMQPPVFPISPIFLTQSGDGFSSEGRPSNRVSGGSRDYDADSVRLIAMVPGRMLRSEPSYTVAANPTLTISIDQSLTPVSSAYLLLCDNDSNTPIVSDRVMLPDISGIFQLSLPLLDNVNSWYYWRLETDLPESCSGASTDVGVQGYIQRIEPDEGIRQQLESIGIYELDTEKLLVYLEQEWWIDALALAVQLRYVASKDDELERTWDILIDNLSLQSIRAQPFTECCIAK